MRQEFGGSENIVFSQEYETGIGCVKSYVNSKVYETAIGSNENSIIS